jgi:GNAT superfamily N-acetyltransferase
MEIRFLEEDDYLEFKVVLLEFFQYAGNENPKEEDLRGLFRKVLDENSNYFIIGAFDGNKMAGMISMTFGESSYKTSAFCWCDDLFVRREFRNKGIGGRLIKEVQIQSVIRNCSNILVGVGENEVIAETFYTKNEFLDMKCKLWTLPIEKK